MIDTITIPSYDESQFDGAHVVLEDELSLWIVARVPEPTARAEGAGVYGEGAWSREEEWRDAVRTAIADAGWADVDVGMEVIYIVWDPGRDQTEEEILAAHPTVSLEAALAYAMQEPL